jgi:alkylhydroperoxidase family enzyme
MLTMEEAEAVERMMANRRDPEAQRRSATSAMRNTGPGLGSSGAAMIRVPDISNAWRGASFGSAYQSDVSEVLMNYVSDAVSVKNECYYCQTHQLHKLSNLGVTVEQMAMARVSDTALPPNERLAVSVGRQVTSNPVAVEASDIEALVEAFGEAGARDLVVQACRFNFMNRLTGGLRLPPEVNPRHTFEEVVTREKELRLSAAGQP